MGKGVNSEKTGVYLFHNPSTDESYVGSGYDVFQRKRSHERNLAAGTHVNRKFQEAYRRDPNFDFVSVSTGDREAAFDLEQSVIDEFMGNPLFLNLSKDARHCNADVSDETRERLSRSLSGLKRSDETKERIRQAKLGVPRSEEVKERLREARTGTKASEETRAKMSEARKGMVMPPRTQEHMDKIREAKAGFTHSEESIRRIRENAPNARPVIFEGKEYPSISEASRVTGTSHKTIRKRIS